MPIITKAGSPVKGSPTEFTLDKAELLTLISDPYFLDTDNWKSVQLRYKSSTGKQKETVKFDAAITPCVGDFSVSLKANNEFLIHSIVIKDFDNGSFKIPRSALTSPELEFDVVLVPLDNTAPTVSSISGPANGTYVTSDVLSFTVNFSETVLVTGSPILKLDIGGVERNASYASGSNSSALVFEYTVVSSDNDSDGVQATSLVLNSGTIKDAANNNANLSFSTQTFSAVLVDTVVPTISSISGPANGLYNGGQTLSFTVNFSETVLVTGSPILKLDIGGVERNASYASGSNSSALVFEYIVFGTDIDTDGIQVTSLVLNGGTIKDAANSANLSFSSQTFSGVTVDSLLSFQDYIGLNGPVKASLKLADNSIIHVGEFTSYQKTADSITSCSRIVKFLSNGEIDTTFMNNVGSGFNNNANTIVTDGTNLYVGGGFTSFNGVTNNANRVAKLSLTGVFDQAFSNNLDVVSGTKATTSGFNGTINTIIVDGTNIYVGGGFATFKGVTNNARGIAKLSTSGVFDQAFSNNLDVVSGTKATTSGFSSPSVNSIIVDGTNLYVGGGFTSFKGVTNNARCIAKLSTSGVFDQAFSDNLDVVSGTKATTSGFDFGLTCITISGTNLYVGGSFTTFKGVINNARYIAKLSTSGVFDQAFSDNLDVVSGTKAATSGFNSGDTSTVIATDGTNLYVGGGWNSFKGVTNNAKCIAKLSTSGVFDQAFSDGLDAVSGTKANTSGFNTFSGLSNRVNSILIDGSSLYVGGPFFSFKNKTANFLCKISNIDGSVLSNEYSHFNTNSVNDMAIDLYGNKYVVGSFFTYNGFYSSQIIKFLSNGEIDVNFTNNMGAGFNSTISTIFVDGTNLYVGGGFTSFNGVTNNAKGIAKLSTSGVFDQAFSDNLDVVSGTKATTSGFDGIISTIFVDGTNLYVGGSFTSFKGVTNNARYIAKLSTSGVFDQAFSNNLDVVSGTKAATSGFGNAISTIFVDGINLYVGGSFTTFKGVTNNARYIAKLSTSGVFDQAFSDNLDVVSGTKATTSGFGNAISTIVVDGTNIYVGGGFTSFNGVTNNAKGIAKLSTSGVFDQAFSDNLDVVSGTKATTSGFNGTINTIIVDGTNIYVGGGFATFKGVTNNANRVAKLSLTGVFDQAFSDNLDVVSGTKAATSGFNSGNINSIVKYGNNLFIGGSFTFFKNQIWQRIYRLITIY